MPAYAAFAFVMALVAGSFPGFETSSVLRSAVTISLWLLVVAPLIAGFLHGRFDAAGGPRIDRLRATRPLTDRSLAWILGEAALRSTLATWAVALLAPAVTLLWAYWFRDSAHVSKVVEGLVAIPCEVGPVNFVLGSLLAAGVAAGVGGIVLSLALSGSNWLLQLFAVVPIGLGVLGIMVERVTGNDQWRLALPHLVFWIATAFLPLFVVAAWITVRRRLLSRRSVLRLFSLFLATATVTLLRLGPRLGLWPLSLTEPRTLLLLAGTAVIYLPVLLAPWMLSLNRHR